MVISGGSFTSSQKREGLGSSLLLTLNPSPPYHRVKSALDPFTPLFLKFFANRYTRPPRDFVKDL